MHRTQLRRRGTAEKHETEVRVGKGKTVAASTRQMDPGSDSLSYQGDVISETSFNDELLEFHAPGNGDGLLRAK